jgi:hypothetical protein
VLPPAQDFYFNGQYLCTIMKTIILPKSPVIGVDGVAGTLEAFRLPPVLEPSSFEKENYTLLYLNKKNILFSTNFIQ